MRTPEETAEHLIELFSKTSDKLSDDSRIEYPTALLHAKSCVDILLSSTGADRGYQYWSEVKFTLDNK